MRLFLAATIGLGLAVRGHARVARLHTATTGPATCSTAAADVDSGATLGCLAQNALRQSRQAADEAAAGGGACAAEAMQLRHEWRTLEPTQQRAFVAAVQCVMGKASRYAAGAVPGATSLFEDFTAVHLNQTPAIHETGYFLTWHRYFTWLYEREIQACGFAGGLPYWEWGRDAAAPQRSPVFDGTATSLGGDGTWAPHAGLVLARPGMDEAQAVRLAPGTGSGCVTTGPFGHLTTGLGPVVLPQYGRTEAVSVADPLADNRRCVRRDLNADALRRFASFRNITDTVVQPADVVAFQALLQGDPRFHERSLGVHGGGHYAYAGDPGGDPFISPGDPAFYLHHSMVDRVYWLWQNQAGGTDAAQRFAVADRRSTDDPSLGNVTLADTVDMHPVGGTAALGALVSTVDGPFCYGYA